MGQTYFILSANNPALVSSVPDIYQADRDAARMFYLFYSNNQIVTAPVSPFKLKGNSYLVSKREAHSASPLARLYKSRHLKLFKEQTKIAEIFLGKLPNPSEYLQLPRLVDLEGQID